MPKARPPGQNASMGDDLGKLEEWIDAYGQDVMHLAYSYVHHYQQAEDITQDVFLRAWRNRDSFQGKSSVKTWLLSIAANRCKDWLRSAVNRREVADDGGVIERNHTTHGTAELVADKLARDELWGIVHQLPEKYREVVVLFYERDLSGQEIASVLSITEQTVRTRLHRGRQLLRDMLNAKEVLGNGP